MPEVIIYMKQGCPYCRAAREHFQHLAVPFDEVDVQASAGAMERMVTASKGQRRVPVIVQGDRVTIGFEGGS
jgi:glutaredoxin 3